MPEGPPAETTRAKEQNREAAPGSLFRLSEATLLLVQGCESVEGFSNVGMFRSEGFFEDC